MMKNDPFWLEGQQNTGWPTNRSGYLQLEKSGELHVEKSFEQGLKGFQQVDYG